MLWITRSQYRPYYQPFFLGITIGFTIAFFLLAPATIYKPSSNNILVRFSNDDKPQELKGVEAPESDVGNHQHHKDVDGMFDTSVADNLYNKVRVLCWIMTGPNNHEKKARHVKATWGKRCNILVFMSSKADDYLPAVALPVVEDRDHLWSKTKEAMKFVYQNYYNEADWFLKADDDTYVVMENLRHMLSDYEPTDPIYHGCRFKPYVKQGYMSGGAGYVLSKEALRRFVELAIPNKNICKQADTGSEDVEIGKCLEGVGVKAGDDRDSEGRGRFFPLPIESVIIPGYLPKGYWYYQYMYYEQQEGMECCSDSAISFHYISPNQMYVMEYLIYHLQPFGIKFNSVRPAPTERNHTQALLEGSNNATNSTGFGNGTQNQTGV